MNAAEIPHQDRIARRKQTLNMSFWAIREVLEEQKSAALAELIHLQRIGESVEHVAARLTALEDVYFAFEQHNQIMKEPLPHDASE